MRETRKATCALIEAARDGLLTWEAVARAAINYMSEDDVADMARINGLLPDEEDGEGGEDGDDDTVCALASRDMRYRALAVQRGYDAFAYNDDGSDILVWWAPNGGYYGTDGSVAELRSMPLHSALTTLSEPAPFDDARALGRPVDAWVGHDPRTSGTREPSYPDVRIDENGTVEIC